MIIWPDECIVWDGKRLPKGYGYDRINGPKRLAHRHVWEMFNGTIGTRSVQVLHSCDNPPCFNLRHLSLGTNQDNVNEMVAKNRQTFGEKNPRATLTWQDVHEIRVARLFGSEAKQLARLFHVNTNTVTRIVAGERWVA